MFTRPKLTEPDQIDRATKTSSTACNVCSRLLWARTPGAGASFRLLVLTWVCPERRGYAARVRASVVARRPRRRCRHNDAHQGDTLMKAVVNRGPRNFVVEDVPDPTIEDPLDAVIRITTANICGSDLHPYEG